MILPTGSWELEDIERHLQGILAPKGIVLSLKHNNNTLRSIIKCSHIINSQPQDSIGRLLGFTRRSLSANIIHESDLPVILKISALRVECSIISGACINEKKVHAIHAFFTITITVNTIDNIQLRIVDQGGNLVNFHGEIITIRLYVKTTNHVIRRSVVNEQ